MTRPSFSIIARKEEGEWTFDQKLFKRLAERLKDGEYDFIVEKRIHSRSAAQNRAYWLLIVTPCSESSGYESDEVHELLKLFCNPKVVTVPNHESGTVDEVTIGGSTAALDVEEFSKYYKRCQQFAAEKWNCYCADPNEDAQFSDGKVAKAAGVDAYRPSP